MIGRILRWPPWSLPLAVTLYNPYPLSVGGSFDLLLANRIWQGWLHFTISLCLSRPELDTLLLALKKRAFMLRTAYGEGHVAGNCRWFLAPGCSLQLTASKKPGPSALQPQGNEFCQQPETAWKWILPQASLQMRRQRDLHLDCSFVRPWAEEPAQLCP